MRDMANSGNLRRFFSSKEHNLNLKSPAYQALTCPLEESSCIFILSAILFLSIFSLGMAAFPSQIENKSASSSHSSNIASGLEELNLNVTYVPENILVEDLEDHDNWGAAAGYPDCWNRSPGSNCLEKTSMATIPSILPADIPVMWGKMADRRSALTQRAITRLQ